MAPLLLAATAALAAGAPASDPPGTVLARVAAPTHVAALDGVAVFGAYDPAARAYVVMRRGRDGRIAPVGVPPVPLPAFAGDRFGRRLPAAPPAFEVTLGRGPGGGLTAVYLRCPAPARASCRLAATDVATGSERLVAGTGRALRGAIWGSRVVLVRRDRDGIQRLYAARADGRGELRRLRFPRIRVIGPEPDQTRPIDRRQAAIAFVEVRRQDVAYVVDFRDPGDSVLASSELWLNRGDRPPARVARVGTGGASSGFREYLQPRLAATSVTVFQQGRDQGNGVQRWSLRGRLLGAGSIATRTTYANEVTGGVFDRGRFLFATNPYQGDGCAAYDEPPEGATCPVLDSGPVSLRRPSR